MMPVANPLALTIPHPNDRMFGLDVCRAIAILAVVTGHMTGHSVPHPMLASMGFVGLFGVDLFFCLSGFLIGRILLKESARWPETKEKGLYAFWYRRWMRTLPLYFFYFLVSLKHDWRGPTSVLLQLPYLVFAQNLAWPMTDFYRLTWSLAVEEWFYYLFPLLILLWIGLGKNPRQAAIVTIACFLLVPPLLRLLLPGNPYDFKNLDEGIRAVVVFRLDAIGFGVLAAYIYQWHRELFQRLADHWYLFLGLVIFCMVSTKVGHWGLSNTKFFAPFYFSVSAFAFAGLIPFFHGLTPSRFKLFNRFVKYTSLISYSMYLGHIFAFTMGIHAFLKLGIFETTYPNPWLTYPIFFLLVYLLATITYFVIEKPILAIRDGKSKGNTPSPTVATSA